ncbi:unnamed protein product [Phaeothamnion confervicola]
MVKAVVIGAGYAGTAAAAKMEKMGMEVTIFNSRERFVHLMGGLRASLVANWSQRVLPPLTGLLKTGKVVLSPATRIDPAARTVTAASGESVTYDVLVLATGYLSPKTVGSVGTATTAEAMGNAYAQRRATLAEAQNVLIIGGGPVGIELAGEIATEMPGKKVTLLSSKDLMENPLAPYREKFKTFLRTRLLSLGVAVQTNVGKVAFDASAVDEFGSIVGQKRYTWEGGEIDADLCFVATGGGEPASIYSASGLGDWLDETGHVKVADTFAVTADNAGGVIFAVGDCNDLALPKLGYLAGEAGKAVAKNAALAAALQPLKPLAGKPQAMALVPVARLRGAGQLVYPVIGDFFTRTIKGKDLFCTKTWGAIGAGVPPPS